MRIEAIGITLVSRRPLTVRTARLAAIGVCLTWMSATGAAKAADNGWRHSHFVSPRGNDAGPGTHRDPWKTIQHAADVSRPGDTIYVRDGVYHERVTVSSSGSRTGGDITFTAYPGERPILDGSILNAPTDTWSAFFLIVNQSYIVVRGFEMRNYLGTRPGQQPAGVLIDGYGSHIAILGNRIHHIQVLRSGASSCDPDSCNGHGIAVYGENGTRSLNHIRVEGNEVYDLKTGWSESVTVDGNVEQWTIADNKIHDNDNIGIDAAGFYEFSPDPATDQARDGEIRGNLVYGIDTTGNPAYMNSDGTYSRFASGIYVDGGARIIVERNDSHDNDLGIQAASENPGHSSDHVTVRDNLVYHSANVGIAIGGYDPTVGGTTNTDIVNNTLFENDVLNAGFGELFIQSNVSNCVFKNNLLYANAQGLFISNYVPFGADSTPLAVDYNLYDSPDTAAGSGWMWNNTFYLGFEAYRTATGNDAHSIFADPRFVRDSAIPPDLKTEPRSPVHHAGVDLGSAIVGAEDFAGRPRTHFGRIDIGAYETD